MSRIITQPITADLLAKFDAKTAALPVKPLPPKTKFSLRELVVELYDAILGLKAKGYSAADICELLAQDLGASIAQATLNSYLRQEGKKRKQQQRQRQREQRLAQPSTRSLAELPPAQTAPLEVPLSSPSGITMDVEFSVVDRVNQIAPVDLKNIRSNTRIQDRSKL